MQVDKAAVAERFEVACRQCKGTGEDLSFGGISTCPDCLGYGVRKPLQRACLGGHYGEKFVATCKEVGCPGLIPIDDYDTLEQAILDKGWWTIIVAYERGDSVVIGRLGTSYTVGMVEPALGLRGTEAIWAALDQALGVGR